MDGDLGSRLGHTVARGRFGNTGSLDPRLANEIGRATGHGGKHGVDIAPVGGIGAVIAGEDGGVVFERHSWSDGVTTDVIDEFMVRDGMQPGGEGPVAIIGHAP